LLLLQEEKQSRKLSLSNMRDEALLVHNQSLDDVTNTGCFGVSCQENWKLFHSSLLFRIINFMVLGVFLRADTT
jgi:hypothetical protein